MDESAFTLNVWFNSKLLSGTKSLYDDGWGTYELRTTASTLTWYINNGSIIKINTANTLSTDTWYMATAIIDDSTKEFKLYVNGDLKDNDTYSGSLASGGSNICFGSTACGSGSNYFNGTLDDVLVFNRVLSATEIKALYNSSEHYIQRDLTGLSEGAQSYTANVVDIAGNRNSTSLSFDVDLTFPNITFDSTTDADGLTKSVDNVFVNVTAVDNAGSGVAHNISAFIDWDNSLVGWWRMDDLNSSGDVIDYTGKNNGTVVGDAKQVEAGYFGKGFEFDGTGDYISTSFNPDMNNPLTISMWIKSNELVGESNRAIWSIYTDDNNRMYLNCPSNGGTSCTIVSKIDGGTTTTSSAIKNSIDLSWHNVLVVLNENNHTYYYDGELIISEIKTNISQWVGVPVFYVGTQGGVDNFFNGTIDDVLVFNRSLSADEIAALYANTSATYLEVNYTGLADGTHTFKAYTQDIAGNVNETGERSVNIDISYPTWSNNETNLTASTPVGNNVYFNITLTESSPDSYIFSWYNGTDWENTTASYTNGEEIEVIKTINSDIGTINWTWYINDTANNVNQTDVWNITLDADDAVAPNVNVNYPVNGTTYPLSSINFNVTAVDNVGMGSCWYSLNSGVNNYSMSNTTGAPTMWSATNSSIADGSYTVNFYCNDTNNNVNNSESVVFTIETGTNVSICRNLDIEDGVYTLQNDISALDNCFVIGAENVTLDFNGYTISQGPSNTGVVVDGYNYTTIRNGSIDGFYYGISLANNENNTITNMVLMDVDEYGIWLLNSSNNNITNIIFPSGGDDDTIHFQASSDSNILTNITIQSAGLNGIRMIDSSNNIFTDIIIESSTSNGFIISGCSNNQIINGNISGSGLNDVDLSSTSLSNVFLNVTYSNSKESVEAGSELIRKWYYQAYVNDTAGNDVSNANVSAFNNTGDFIMNLTTNASGWTEIGELIDYVNDGGTKSYYSNYNIYATNSNYFVKNVSYNVTANENNLAHNMQMHSANLTVCDTLDQANTVYTLQNNITASGNCFTIAANNVTLDFNGYNITGDDGVGDYGVESNTYNSTTIKNGYIYDFGDGIKLEDNYNNNIINMTIYSTTAYGVILSSSNNNTLTDNIMNYTGSDEGLHLASSSYNTITGNIVSWSDDRGVYLNGDCNFNILTNNTFNFNDNVGISIRSSSNNTFQYNTINSNGASEIYIVSSSNSNNFTNNNIWNCSGTNAACIYVDDDANNNVFDANKINLSAGYGIRVDKQHILEYEL